ncbi:MAG: lycopene cyclase domain-containing protein [Candidatus Zhuqueibacterota bacterium]
MNAEYLIFTLAVIIGPLALSFDKRVHFVGKWPGVARAILPTLIIFGAWDSLVAGRHWWFNPDFTLKPRIAGLPIEEWLFFIVIPYACLFVWEVFAAYFKNRELRRLNGLRFLLMAGIPLGIFIYSTGKEYTGLVIVALGFVGVLDDLLKTKLFGQLRVYQLIAISMGFMLIFNGYLTWRPVIQYNESFISGARILTIPIEDFGFGLAMILMSTMLYEKFKRGRRG